MSAHRQLVPAEVDPRCFTVIPLSLAQQLHVVPVAVDGDRVTIALTDTADLFALDDLRLALPHAQLDTIAAPASVIDALLTRWARTEAAEREGAAVREISAERAGTADVAQVAEEGRMGQLVGQVLDAAIALGASDVHFEPVEDQLQIRFRVDGVLHQHASFPSSLTSGVINRLKHLATIDPAERRVPQGGRFSRTTAAAKVDCRVETLPIPWGGDAGGLEGAVVRLFDQGRGVRTLEQIGFGDALQARIAHALTASNGAFLVTGPTGSGKTSTLYAALGLAASPQRKTLAIEDPVEIHYPSITQVQVNDKAGLTFASALRSFLRADPDVILVGEIRDDETAQLASRAALTGHLLLSTLHTNTAVGAPSRLADLGLQPYVVSQALRAILAQRLVRRLCRTCRVPYTPTAGDLAAAGWPEDLAAPDVLYTAGSDCLDCSGFGFKGRFAVGELVIVDDDLADAILRGASARDLGRIAAAGGTVPMRTDALTHTASGLTSLDELVRVGI